MAIDFAVKIANNLAIEPWKIKAAISLLDDGATVPFISRYRKEVTGELNDTQLREVEESLEYMRELEDRRLVVISEIEKQGKMTNELNNLIVNAETKARLEDIYKPFKVKRKTRGQIAIENGLLPLADAIYDDRDTIPKDKAQEFINETIKTSEDALDGAKYILMERFSQDPDLVEKLRNKMYEEGSIHSKLKEDQVIDNNKFKDYADFTESLIKIPSHRALAILRGRNENVLNLSIVCEYPFVNSIARYFAIFEDGRPANDWLLNVAKWTWQVKLKLQIEIDLISQMREQADVSAIKVFAKNLKDLLMAPPAGHLVTVGLDPGYRTGVKVVVVDDTGKLLFSTTIFPHPPQNEVAKSLLVLEEIYKKFNVKLFSIGNGTASRETEGLVQELQTKYKELKYAVVSEAGASIYSASKLASEEFPDLDVTYRGSVSIARRLQDPLAELVKIEPKSIGVGQYQHDVNQIKLKHELDKVVEDCVNKVGVDLNTASASLLTRIAGLNSSIAKNIVEHRDKFGKFTNREELLKVTRLGPKAYEQSAGFLRIIGGSNPLDASGVHPESYPLVKKIIDKAGEKMLDWKNTVAKIIPEKKNAKEFVDDKFGLPTILDIFRELEKPGRDPRPKFKSVVFKKDVLQLTDIKVGMEMQGVVTNVANFGAFVNVGVKQEGLVHVSHLSKEFVKDPHTVIKTGDIVKCWVIGIDIPRKRLSLSLVGAKSEKATNSSDKSKHKSKLPKATKDKKLKSNLLGDALRNALAKN